MKTHELPRTDSIEELAKFWDTHDLTDFESQLEDVVEPPFARKAEAVMKIRLPPKEIAAVARMARSKGVPKESLIREWVLEKLNQGRKAG
jgi:predicted DNA binding CopG/RHH family protein